MSVFHAGFGADGKMVRVRFGVDARLDLSEDLGALGIKRALVLTTPEQAVEGATLADELGAACVGVFSGAQMHTPVEVTEDALKMVDRTRADGVVALGGGSTIGLGKAIAWRTDLKQLVLPTTYAGSEATPVLGQTETGRKITFADPKVQPDAIVYDPRLVATLPVKMTVTSGLNAMAHAVEGLYAQSRTRLSMALAIEGLRAFATGLPRVCQTPEHLDAREETLFGAWACGSVLAQGGMALHHKLCHTLGGMLGLPHAATHAIILPHATAYNESAAPDPLRPLAELLGAESAALGLYDFARRLGAPSALRDLGVMETDLDTVAREAAANPYWNPRPIEASALRHLLQRAWDGARPDDKEA